MEEKDQNKSIKREFGLSTLSLNNSISVFILTAIIVFAGLGAYMGMPKELYPEIRLPKIYVNTVYPGNSPIDIENLITRPIEKELKSINGVKEISSTSLQDVSAIIVDFNEDVSVSEALQDVKDAVDKAKGELPSDLDNEPKVIEMDLSEVPIVSINLSGDFEIDKLKEYAEYLEDKLEEFPEVSKVQMSGSVEREIQINVDLYKMEALMLSFGDIETAIARENMNMSGGDILIDGYRRSLRVTSEYKSVEEIKNTVIKSEDLNTIYLSDLAEVKDSYVERQSYARLATNRFKTEGSNPVISLRVIKRGGENLINASKKIHELIDESLESKFPKSLNIVLTEDQADEMNMQLSNLENSIISGVLLVVVVLLFFMGLRNALFVGIAIPLSMFMSFLILSMAGVTINMVVLFGLILALGMLVDNAIVVIENIYTLRENGMSNIQAAKEGVGEVAVAIISSTATTLAAFVPLAFWGGLMGEFMKYLPITLIVVLASSLFVGLVINPVVASTFMKVDQGKVQPNKKPLAIIGFALLICSIPLYIIGETYSWGNIFMTVALITLSNAFILKPMAYWFQNVALVAIEKIYKSTLKVVFKGLTPYFVFFGTGGFLFLVLVVFGMFPPMIVFFPENEPNYVYMYVEAPLGTDVETSNDLSEMLEEKVYTVLEPYKSIVKSVVVNVGENTGNPNKDRSGSITPHKFKVTISFVPFEKRNGLSTKEVKKKMAEMSAEIPGLSIITEKEDNGPPTGAPVNIEISGEDYLVLIKEAEQIKAMIQDSGIPGLDGLGLDLEIGKPELLVTLNRAKARRFGVNSAMLASTLRTAIYGKEVSKFKDGEDEYPINVRLKDEYRYNTARLQDQKLTFRDNKGKYHQVPISSVADVKFSSTYGSVKRKDLERVITVSSNIIEGYNANEIVASIKELLSTHEIPEGYVFKFTGEQEEQAKSMAFLMRAMGIAVAAIFLILVSQFNSVTKPFIIVGSVIFSLIGVFLGLIFFESEFVIIMTGIGIISLAGVVVNNAIVLIDYTELTKQRKMKELGVEKQEDLPEDAYVEAVVEGGYARLRPVLLTAITTVLGLIPLATGLNIDFFGLYASFEPNFYVGGTNADFWGPMAWTVIYGLVFATFLTLVVVPVMYYISERTLLKFKRKNIKVSKK